MGNYIPEISNAVANSAIFDPAPIVLLNGVIANVASFGSDYVESFTLLRDHVEDHQANFVFNMTVFTQLYYDQSQFDVNSYFGTLLGNATVIATEANSAIFANNTVALDLLSNSAVQQVGTENDALQTAIDILDQRATTIALNELVNTPLGAYVLGKAGSDEIKAVVDERNLDVSEELNIAIVDENDPVSNDPTEFIENRDADAR